MPETNVCVKCGVNLIEGLNWYTSQVKCRNRKCKICMNKESLAYHYEHRERVLIKQKEWRKNNWEKKLSGQRRWYRKNRLGTINGLVSVKKRDWVDSCEMCGKQKNKHMQYHHWNINKPELGIWICLWCHRVIHYLERVPDFFEKYEVLKDKIELKGGVAL